ncbi:GNAT family N-acetyltransferase [Tenuibacillus multivorans]|uniref:ElaA protein n=1 Tax=Tenuibacillus multivorans TaxID=237069 RepID=A0A1H0B7L7_9BACI|nr:GNAT family N-acetyltransferase [Tenuibacillus multivorans]GEL78611.1 GNAT family acetyltransferase [Tenuibacillus multivorans]SDN41637.1 ElaA protein [Tenuibacillus multivorans]
MNWENKSFYELSNDELYDILKLRVDVFVVEQNCPYPEIDDFDREARHFFYQKDGQILAYCRMIPPGVKFKEASIGRVITHPSERRTGIGSLMLQEAMDFIDENWENCDVKIEAQAHLQAFYSQCGFETISDEFLEDGIPHVEMLYSI